jgi:hypothetical protein
MDYRIVGLSPQPFLPLYGLSDAALGARNARRYCVDAVPGFPDRIELRDATIGETVLLVNYQHQPHPTPYQSSHAIFVREGALEPRCFRNEVPDVLVRRPLSVRAFDRAHWMLDAELCAGADLEGLITRFFADERTGYSQVHFAKRGCFAARIERTPSGNP